MDTSPCRRKRKRESHADDVAANGEEDHSSACQLDDSAKQKEDPVGSEVETEPVALSSKNGLVPDAGVRGHEAAGDSRDDSVAEEEGLSP